MCGIQFSPNESRDAKLALSSSQSEDLKHVFVNFASPNANNKTLAAGQLGTIFASLSPPTEIAAAVHLVHLFADPHLPRKQSLCRSRS
jgi:hypothetical protein